VQQDRCGGAENAGVENDARFRTIHCAANNVICIHLYYEFYMVMVMCYVKSRTQNVAGSGEKLAQNEKLSPGYILSPSTNVAGRQIAAKR